MRSLTDAGSALLSIPQKGDTFVTAVALSSERSLAVPGMARFIGLLSIVTTIAALGGGVRGW
jgi:hypothetical protein